MTKPELHPGDLVVALQTAGEIREGDIVTVHEGTVAGYVSFDETGGRRQYRRDLFLLLVRRPWHAWADPEWEAKARASAERFVREGLVAQSAEYEP